MSDVNKDLVLGSARSGETGLNGQIPGDQKGGQEVSMQPFYYHTKGWICLRPKDPVVANKMAEAMKQACLNDNLGYDQDSHGSTIYLVKKYGSYAAIPVACEDDCSGLVRGCIYQATGIDVGDFYTANEVEKLKATNLFDVYYTVDQSTYMADGDILDTKTQGHTVIVCSGRRREEPTPEPVGQKVAIPTTDTYIRQTPSLAGIICGVAKKGNRYYILDECVNQDRTWAKIDTGWMSERYCKIETDYPPVDDRVGKTFTLTTDCWIREQPSLTGKKVRVMKKGEEQIIIAVNNDGERDWFAIAANQWVSARYAVIK